MSARKRMLITQKSWYLAEITRIAETLESDQHKHKQKAFAVLTLPFPSLPISRVHRFLLFPFAYVIPPLAYINSPSNYLYSH